MKKNREKKIKISLITLVIVILIAIVISVMIKYHVEGETNMPFNLSKIMIISNAQGISNEDNNNKWNLDCLQNNDIYIEITKNKNYTKTEIIDKILLDNFNVEKFPQKGKVYAYKPNYDDNGVFVTSEECKIIDKLEYIGSEKSNINNLEIANQGGLILLRYTNEDLGNYTSNEDIEIKHDGTLLSKIGINNEEIKYNISFDISIILKSEKIYKANIKLQMPAGNIIQEGTSNYTKTDFKDVIFKRQ